TSMFSDQVSKGNMSLILKEVRTQDRGRYKCYTAISSANKEAFVSVKVKGKRKIQSENDGITCKTSDVYPKPKISWTINGTPKIISPKDPQEDSRGLFSLTSTLPVQPVQDSLTYTCSISSEDSTQTYIAKRPENINKTEIDLGQDITIPCPGSQGETGNFTLTFGSSTVLSYNSETPQPDRIQWNGIEVKVTSKGNIILHKLDSERHAGTYTCEKLTTQSRQLIQTSVQIRTGKHEPFQLSLLIITTFRNIHFC
uniref:HERV-H LTR-associating 2b, tandem duplicate 2 n=1 Tax=Pygocentrus nattereri TaxID=42514 RepID=A0AAR2KHF7_PYGNA